MFYRRLQQEFASIIAQKPIRIIACISLGILLCTAIFLVGNGSRLPSFLVLHFDAFRGIDRFGVYGDIWVLFGVCVGIIAFNFMLVLALFQRDRLLSYIFVGLNLLLSILTFIAIATILYIN